MFEITLNFERVLGTANVQAVSSKAIIHVKILTNVLINKRTIARKINYAATRVSHLSANVLYRGIFCIAEISAIYCTYFSLIILLEVGSWECECKSGFAEMNGTCQLDIGCESGWVGRPFGSKNKCYKFIGQYQLDEAEQKCAELGAKLPLPRSNAEQADFLLTVDSFNISRTVGN